MTLEFDLEEQLNMTEKEGIQKENNGPKNRETGKRNTGGWAKT